MTTINSTCAFQGRTYFFITDMAELEDRKKAIKDALDANDLNAATALVLKDRKVLTQLIRFAYDKETLIGWRAILAVGMAARELVKTNPSLLRETCRKLLWSLSDESGGIGWSAPELLGEIVSADPRQFADLIPLIASVFDIEEAVFRSGVVYALKRIAGSDPDLVLDYQGIIISALHDKDPLLKIFGLQLVGLVWDKAYGSGAWSSEYSLRIQRVVERLRSDDSEAWVYVGAGFQSMLIRDVALNIAIKSN